LKTDAVRFRTKEIAMEREKHGRGPPDVREPIKKFISEHKGKRLILD
jgi:hypothetical protein